MRRSSIIRSEVGSCYPVAGRFLPSFAPGNLLKKLCPVYDSVSSCQLKTRRASGGGRDGVKGAVLWRSSRPLTPSRPLPPSSSVRIADVLSEIRTMVGKPSCIAKRPRARTLILNPLRWQPSGSTNHVFGLVQHHDFLFKLSPRGKRRGVQSFNRSLTATNGALGLPRMRTALPDLCIVLPGAQHPIQPNRQLVRDGHLRHPVMLPPVPLISPTSCVKQ